MQKLVPVSSKGQVVIPAKIRSKLGDPKTMRVHEKDGKVILEPVLSFKEAFGTGGKAAAEIAKEISEDRRREVESERKKLRA
jgi:AbrB family looped-hinge helix DNA binding protein